MPRLSPRPLTALLLVLASLFALLAPRSDRPQVTDPLRRGPSEQPRLPASPRPPVDEPLDVVATMRRTKVGGKILQYCGNGSVDRPAASVRRVIFMIHGNDRQACGAARAVLAAGDAELARHTLVVAPRFPTREDRVDPGADLYWTFYGWSQGDTSVNPDQPISSYAVLDALSDRVGAPERIVAGFSGGGQFVNRYAAGSPLDATRFIVANPSSYLYFGPTRPGGDPALIRACPTYDTYRYGVTGLNPYMMQAGPDTLRRRYASRELVYLLGDADNDPASSSMDKECGAMVQGPNRYERGRRYWAYLPSVFGARITERQSMHIVRGVGHDGGRMLGDPAGRQALFG